MGSQLRPWRTLEEDKNPPAEGFCPSLSLLAQQGKGLPLIVVPACWDLCKVTVRDSHCPEEHVVLVSGSRNEAATEAAAVMGGWGGAWKRM